MSKPQMKDALIRALFNEIAAQGITNDELATRAGYNRKTLINLKYQHNTTRLSTLRDVGALVGLELVWRPMRVDAVDRVDRHDGQQSTNGAS